MMKKIILLTGAIALAFSGAFAQNNLAQQNELMGAHPKRTCATMERDAAMRANHPEFGTLQDLNNRLAPIIEAYNQAQANGSNPEALINIPVVVHIIHNSNENVGSGRNISNAQILSQITSLNEDFRRTNSDASSTPSAFTAVAADCEINFCLARTYPTGHANAGQILPEIGVDRVSTANIAGISNTSSGYSTNVVDNTIKPATYWNPAEVLNFWVCQLPSGLLGYAQFPGGAANTDGVVMGYDYFGTIGTVSAPFDKGRTTTHEVGHFFGLYHIWGDANCGNDWVADTPTQQQDTYGCPSFPQNSCSSSDMFMNYMDYSDDDCMNMFSQGQKARMIATLQSTTNRASLKSSTVCDFATDVNSVSEVNEILIYPNPAENKINITVQNNDGAIVEIYNLIGKAIHRSVIDDKNKTVTIDMSDQANGIYLVKMKIGNKVITEKVIISK